MLRARVPVIGVIGLVVFGLLFSLWAFQASQKGIAAGDISIPLSSISQPNEGALTAVENPQVETGANTQTHSHLVQAGTNNLPDSSESAASSSEPQPQPTSEASTDNSPVATTTLPQATDVPTSYS